MIPGPKIAGNYQQNYFEMANLHNSTGFAEQKMEPSIRKMARDLTGLLKAVKPLEETAANICKDISGLYVTINENFVMLASVTGQIRDVYNKVANKFDFDHFTKVSNIYKDLNTTFNDWAKVQRSSTINWFENIRMMFSFSSQEEQGLESVRNLLCKEYSNPSSFYSS